MTKQQSPDQLLDAVKPEWRGVLRYVQSLRRRSIRPPMAPLNLPWEEIGPGYCYGPAFGHWDIVHQMLDAVEDDPAHALGQLENNLCLQCADGFLPGSVWMSYEPVPWASAEERKRRYNINAGHPPVWPVAVDAIVPTVKDGRAFLQRCLLAARKQLGWFRSHRLAPDGGYYYTDLIDHRWESGVDEGVRYDDAPKDAASCIDATSHVYLLAERAAAWAKQLNQDADDLQQECARLQDILQNRLWSDETGFFHDAWSVQTPKLRRLCQEGIWPVVVGAARPDQAALVIDAMLDPKKFNTIHPLATVALSEPTFSLRMWRGPAWNSMTLWAALGCQRYGRPDAARILLERALDATSAVFVRTGCIWEFYHPHGGDPMVCERKTHTPFNMPCKDYLGHNPLRAMARLWLRCA